VAVVVGEIEDEQLVIRGCGQARHDGARKGVISNLEEVIDAVRCAAEEAEAMASVPVERAAVGIGGTQILGVRATASVPVTGRDRTVSEEDHRRALAACAQVSIPTDFRVLDIIPAGFALDGQAGVDRPVGMPGVRLDASAYVLYTHRTHADTVEQSVNRAAIAVDRLVYEPLAAAEAVLSADERDLGCLLLDVGYGSTEWVLFSEGAVVANGSTNVAGRLFTADLAALLKTTTAAAEKVKLEVGADVRQEGLEGQAVEVPALGGGGRQVHPSTFAAEILHERARDLLVRVHQQLEAEAMEHLARAGVVLTGGGARLDGLQDLAEEIFGHRVRLGWPQALAGLVEPVSGPEWATACGLVSIQHRQHDRVATNIQSRGGILTWLRNALGEFFELGGGS
jgi:cell division protein FtsA